MDQKKNYTYEIEITEENIRKENKHKILTKRNKAIKKGLKEDE